MNTNSQIIRILDTLFNGICWDDVFAEDIPCIYKGISMKREGPLVIFNYGIGADFSDPVVQEARGIIINIETMEVVCWPFRKFGKYDESYADAIDWSSALVQEKLDGSIIKLWFNEITNAWQFSTNSTINAKDANFSTEDNRSFLDIIYSADNYQLIEFEKLCTDYTYIFELTSPFNQVVVKYETISLWHIGTRNNKTGVECNVDIGIKKPRVYPCKNLDECIGYVSDVMNKSNQSGKIDNVDCEGFVVVDKNYHRIKIKAPIYIILHNIVTDSVTSKRALIKLLRDKIIDIEFICNNYIDMAHHIKYYDYKLTEFLYRATAIINVSRQLYEKYNHDRKQVAMKIKNLKLSAIGFKALDNIEIPAKDILDSLTVNNILKYIEDYEPEDLSYLFKD